MSYMYPMNMTEAEIRRECSRLKAKLERQECTVNDLVRLQELERFIYSYDKAHERRFRSI